MKKVYLLSIVALITIIVAGTVYFFFLRESGTEYRVTVVDRGPSVCTTDVPSSTCGEYEVTVQLPDGQNKIYKVSGFNNTKSAQYDAISEVLYNAQSNESQIAITVNQEGYITKAR